jgi:hypothetical protein
VTYDSTDIALVLGVIPGGLLLMPASASTGATTPVLSLFWTIPVRAVSWAWGRHWSSGEGVSTDPPIWGLHAVGFAGSNCKGRSMDAKINCSLVRVYKLLEGRLRGGLASRFVGS